jgi:hypothetical protein
MTRSLPTLLRLQSVDDTVVPFLQHGGQQFQPAMTVSPVKVQSGFQKAAAYHGYRVLQPRTRDRAPGQALMAL